MAQGNKTEKPTPRRQQKAREQGQVARSRDLANVLASIAAVAVFAWGVPAAVRQWNGLLRTSLDLAWQQDIEGSGPLLFWNAWAVVRWTAPAMLAAWAVAVGSSVMQGGFVFVGDALSPKLERMSPAAKVRQMFSLSGVSALLKSLLPFAAIGYIAIHAARQRWTDIVQASGLGLTGFWSLSASLLCELAWKSGLVLLVWAGVDYALVWRKLQGDLMMSHDEIREEAKETDGNPTIKARIRRLQRQMRRRQLLDEASKATVVIANPTHFAVALRYEPDMDAPTVVAKGRDLLAQKIKAVARWQGIAIIENPPLAQALYRTVDVGRAIPAKLYTAVAEILAFVYQAQAQARTQVHRSR